MVIQIGIEARKSATDSTGLMPEDYAGLSGHYAYNHLVERMIQPETCFKGCGG